MEVILRQDIKNLGFADDIVKVKDGYGRNYLIPNGMAMIANDSARKMNAETMKQRAHKLGKLKADAERVAGSLEGVTISIPAKVGENGKLFGSVTSTHLVDVLHKMGYNIEKKHINMPVEHVKQVGSYKAEVVLHRDVKVKITFDVVDQKEN